MGGIYKNFNFSGKGVLINENGWIGWCFLFMLHRVVQKKADYIFKELPA